MKILLLGIATEVLDEGAKNVATNLANELGKNDELLILHQRRVLTIPKLVKIIRFRPDVILSVHGPSPKTILLLFILRLISGLPKTLAIGTQPHESRLLLILMRYFRPNLVFAQSREWYNRFKRIGVETCMLPNGVNLDKFIPCSDKRIVANIRKELGVSNTDKVALHIGPINHNRNHELLIRLQKETAWQVVVIGSISERCLPHIVTALEQAGVKIHVKYFPDINQIYAAADAYVFPVMDRSGSIEFPLTVLEAMACDRPVVTYPFRGLPDFLSPSKSLKYFHDFDELVGALTQITNKEGNRTVAQNYSWASVTTLLRTFIKSKLG